MPLVINSLGVDTYTHMQTHTHTRTHTHTHTDTDIADKSNFKQVDILISIKPGVVNLCLKHHVRI